MGGAGLKAGKVPGLEPDLSAGLDHIHRSIRADLLACLRGTIGPNRFGPDPLG
jgi:hypothetical protein